MEIVEKKPEATTETKPGQPAFTSEQPAAPLAGRETTEGKAKAPDAAVNAAKAKILAATSKPATLQAATAAAPAAQAAAAPVAEVTDETIAKAAAKAAEIEAAKAAAIQPEDDFATRAKKAEEFAKKGDALKALEALGIPLDQAVRQATGSPATTTEEEKLRAENKRLADENAQIKRDAEARQAQAAAEASYHATVSTIVADPAFPNIKTADDVAKALEGAKTAHKTLTSEMGRDLNETEKDRLVRHYLKRYNDRTVASEQPAKVPAGDNPSVRAGTVAPARPAGRRTVAQVKADILAGKRQRT